MSSASILSGPKTVTTVPADRPFAIENFLASLVEALKVHGDARSIAVILEGQCRFQAWDSDFGVNTWKLFIAVPVHVFYALTDDERKATEEAIGNAGGAFFAVKPQDALDGVVITPKVSAASEGWREEALKFVKGEGVTNQGRVRSDNIAAKQHQGLLFRSQAEITLFEAMVRAQLAVSPLPVFVRKGKSYNRIEPDFLVVYKGLTFIIEVDGDNFHKELPAEADKRLVPLTYEGVEVRRIRAAELPDAAAADSVVKQLVEFMARRKEAR